MLINNGASQAFTIPTQNLARVAHRQCQSGTFPSRHAVEKHGHGKSADLAFTYCAISERCYEILDFAVTQNLPIALFPNDLLR
jgi:hypothetical protein